MIQRALSVLVLSVFLLAPLGGFSTAQASAQAATGRTIVVNTLLDDTQVNNNCTLREALLAANTNSPVDACPAGTGDDTIKLGSGVYQLSLEGREEDAALTGDLDILASVTIRASSLRPAVIDAGGIDRVLHIPTAGIQVELVHLDVRNGQPDPQASNTDGLGILNHATLTLRYVSVYGNGYDAYNSSGAGIYNTGTLNVKNSRVGGNAAAESQGGGIYNSGQLKMMDSNMDSNTLDRGAGGSIYNAGTAHIRRSHLSGGFDVYSNDGTGGVIANTGTLLVEESEIFNGSAGNASLIANSGDLTLVDSLATGGHNRWSTGYSISTSQSLRLVRSMVVENANRGIVGEGMLSIQDSVIARNRAASAMDADQTGGAAIQFYGTAGIHNTIIAENLAGNMGGAIHGGGQWTIDRSAIISNTASNDDLGWGEFETGYGGAMVWEGGNLAIYRSTFSGNHASDAGGAIYVRGGEIRLINDTVANNSSGSGLGSGLAMVGGNVSLRNTLLAANARLAANPGSADCHDFDLDPQTGEPADGWGYSMGYNLIGIVDGCEWYPEPSDQLGTAQAPLDPRLEVLAGGPDSTFTHALLPDSPAIDTQQSYCAGTDQRGIERPQGAGCDTGAYEYGAALPLLPVGIDIRPGDASNIISLNSYGTVPVAILSTAEFYAPLQTNPAELTFGQTGLEDALEWLEPYHQPNCKVLDANRDRLLDVVCRFWIQKTGFQPGSSVGSLNGITWSGVAFQGSDYVQIQGQAVLGENAAETQADFAAYEGDVLFWLPLLRK